MILRIFSIFFSPNYMCKYYSTFRVEHVNIGRTSNLDRLIDGRLGPTQNVVPEDFA